MQYRNDDSEALRVHEHQFLTEPEVKENTNNKEDDEMPEEKTNENEPLNMRRYRDENGNVINGVIAECPNCKSYVFEPYNFCPKCGTELDWRNKNNAPIIG